MKRCPLLLALILMNTGAVYAAAGDDAAKKAADRYSQDRKLCADEPDSAHRMQCLRDAKAEYDKALAAAAKTGSAPAPCNECGKVTGVKVVEKEGKGGPVGMIAGGVVGGLLGHQVGGGTGKDLATIAGAAGGAYAGSKVEGKMKSTKVWEVSVHFENGDQRTFHFEHDPGYAAGDAVKASGNSIVRR